MIIIGHHPPDISIHALRKESDRMIVTDSTIEYAFQSTLSVRRATVAVFPVFSRASFQSTLSVRRATGVVWNA